MDLCYGNHDVSYLWDAMESGYSVQARITAIEGITKLENVLEKRYRFIHRIDNVLFSHAGLTERFVFRSCGYHVKEIDDRIRTVNEKNDAYKFHSNRNQSI